MLRVNVGLSRKLTRDYNSTGFSLNLEGELCAGLDDPEATIERIKEFYDVAEEALNQQIERYEGESAIAHRDEISARENGQRISHPKANPDEQPGNGHQPPSENGNGQSPQREPATNKQIQFLLNLGKRQGLATAQLEKRIESLLGKRVGVYDLTKSEAGAVIEVLNQPATPATNGNSRSRVTR